MEVYERTKELTKKDKDMLEALKGRPVVFDEECPPSTEEELKRGVRGMRPKPKNKHA